MVTGVPNILETRYVWVLQVVFNLRNVLLAMENPPCDDFPIRFSIYPLAMTNVAIGNGNL